MLSITLPPPPLKNRLPPVPSSPREEVSAPLSRGLHPLNRSCPCSRSRALPPLRLYLGNVTASTAARSPYTRVVALPFVYFLGCERRTRSLPQWPVKACTSCTIMHLWLTAPARPLSVLSTSSQSAPRATSWCEAKVTFYQCNQRLARKDLLSPSRGRSCFLGVIYAARIPPPPLPRPVQTILLHVSLMMHCHRRLGFHLTLISRLCTAARRFKCTTMPG